MDDGQYLLGLVGLGVAVGVPLAAGLMRLFREVVTLRTESERDREVHEEIRDELKSIRSEVRENGQRTSRIEGRLNGGHKANDINRHKSIK